MQTKTWWTAALAAGLCFAPRASAASQTADAGAERLYRRYCASCHGDDLMGKEWREFKPDIPDFTSAAWHARRTDAQLLVSILDGKASGMPSFRRKLNEKQQRALVAFLRGAAPSAPTQKPDAAPDDFDRRFEEMERELDRLKKQFYECDQAKKP
jgi:mono/diheme cytochrome c family protein